MPAKHLKAIKPMFPSTSSWKLRAGDLVQVMVGKDKGKQGTVLTVVNDKRRPAVFVSGVNMITRHMKAQMFTNGERQAGYSVQMEGPIHYSNVMLVDPQTNKPVRVKIGYADTYPYRKVRISRGRNASGCIIPWPKVEHKPKNTTVGDKDTRPEDAEAITYDAETDFNLEVPSAHRKLRELRELRDAERRQRQELRQQQQQLPQPRQPSKLLFSSSRGYHTSSAAAAACELQEQLHKLSVADSSSVQQRLPFSGGSRGSSSLIWLLGCGSSSRHLQYWCGVAAAPLML